MIVTFLHDVVNIEQSVRELQAKRAKLAERVQKFVTRVVAVSCCALVTRHTLRSRYRALMTNLSRCDEHNSTKARCLQPASSKAKS